MKSFFNYKCAVQEHRCLSSTFLRINKLPNLRDRNVLLYIILIITITITIINRMIVKLKSFKVKYGKVKLEEMGE